MTFKKQKMKPYLIVLVLFLFVQATLGQKGYYPGYIVTNDFDTITGLIYQKPNAINSKTCTFIKEKNGSPQVFKPEDLHSYKIENSKYYVSREVPIDSVNQIVFLEYLVDGIVDLYYLKDQTKEYYFIEKDNRMIPLSNEGKTVTIMEKGVTGDYHERKYYQYSNQYKRMLLYLFQDSPFAQKEIPRTNFEYKSLINLTTDYHNDVCDSYDCVDYTKSTRQNIFIEPFFGIIDSWMGLEKSSDYAHNFKPYMGVNLRFKPFKGFSRWNFITGLNYSTNDFDEYFDNTLKSTRYVTYWTVYHIVTKYTVLRIPLTAEYSLTRSRLQPFISLGLNNVLLLNKDFGVYENDKTDPVPGEKYLRTWEYGFAGGFGLRYSFMNGSYIYLKNAAEYRFPSARFGWILDRIKVYSWLFNFGYGIKL